jgi:hypothetical protein
MKTRHGHLTYCTNIHTGETWEHHFDSLKKAVPEIKRKLSPDKPFGIGLRLSHLASQELAITDKLQQFINWLANNNCYVFTMNGFPYGGFHHTRVKDQVHAPDWTTQDRVLYTIQLFQILARLLPEGMDGGVSSSPLSYRLWHNSQSVDTKATFETATENILKVLDELIVLRETTGRILHLDIEPEPDGLIDNGSEFIDWYQTYLLPMGILHLAKAKGWDEIKAGDAIRDHIRLCYDVCHFAVGYEDHRRILSRLAELKIKVGKIQISAALKAPMAPLPSDREAVVKAFSAFNESTYLHQVVALQDTTHFLRYPDLSDALADAMNVSTREWRSHFHVPVFVKDYGVLKSTQEDIEDILEIHRQSPICDHLEVETYTWEVLPEKLKLPLTDSIARELQWVGERLN